LRCDGNEKPSPGELTVGEIAIREVFTCKPNEDIHEALYEMGSHQVRRLPVVNDEGVPQGVLSLDDLIAHSELGKLRGACDLSSEEVAATMKKVYGLRQPVVASNLSKAAVN